jgi:hypothetical protein
MSRLVDFFFSPAGFKPLSSQSPTPGQLGLQPPRPAKSAILGEYLQI